MGRRKSDIERAARIEFNKECRRSDAAIVRLADDVWRCVSSHTSPAHRLRLKVGDEGQVLECVPCGIPAIIGSDDMMEFVIEYIKALGIEFEVVCETKVIQ